MRSYSSIVQNGQSLYIHLPFCRRRCYYCDFPISVVGDKSSSIASKTKSYIDLVFQELENTAGSKDIKLMSCYLGGGTPSLASGEEIHRLLSRVRDTYSLTDNAEVTIEADPGTFNEEKLKEYCAAGVTRLSLGVQTFEEDELQAIGRSHSAQEALDAIELVAKFADSGKLRHGWSLDIISGLPGQTLNSWQRTLEKTIQAQPWHVSAYDLQIQPGTAFGYWYGAARPQLMNNEKIKFSSKLLPVLPTEDEAADLYIETSRVLQKSGYEHYEISSYSRLGRSTHNALYWQPGGTWLALGLGATSAHAITDAPYPVSQKFSRPRTMSAYATYVAELRKNKTFPPQASTNITLEDALAEDLMTSLRTAAGLPLARVRSLAGPKHLKAILRATEDARLNDLAFIYHTPQPHARSSLRLSDPDGFLCSNYIIANIFAELGNLGR